MERRANGRASPQSMRKGSREHSEDALGGLANTAYKPGIGRRTKEPNGDSSSLEYLDRIVQQADSGDISCRRDHDVMDGFQLYKVRPDLVHPSPIPLERAPLFIHSLESLSVVYIASNSNTVDVSTSEQTGGIRSTILVDSAASDLKGQPDMKHPMLWPETESQVCNGVPHSTSSCQPPTPSTTANTTFSSTPTSQTASIMSFGSQSSLSTACTPTLAVSLSTQKEPQSIIASNNHTEETVLSSGDNNNDDDDEQSQVLSSIERNSHPMYVVLTALTDYGTLNTLTSRKAAILTHAPSHSYSTPGALPEISSSDRSSFPRKYPLYEHRFASRSDSGVHRVALQDVRSPMERDIDVHSNGDAGRTTPTHLQEKRSGRQSGFNSLFSSFSNALLSVRDRNSSKANLIPTLRTSDPPAVMCLNQTRNPIRESMREPRNDTPTQETESWYCRLYKVSRPSPMSSKAHSKSMPALSPDITTYESSNYNVRPLGCTCYDRNIRAPCRFHKELPSLPIDDHDDVRNSINYGGNSKRYPGLSTGSLQPSSAMPCERTASSGLPKEARYCVANESSEHCSSNAQNHTHSVTNQARTQVVVRKTKGRDVPQPSTIIRRAIKRHAGVDLQPHVVVNRRRIQPEKDHEVQVVSTHDVREYQPLLPQQHRRVGPREQVYLSQMSASSPSLQRSPTESSRWDSSSRVDIQPRRLATGSSVSAQVSAINVRAEIVAPAAFQSQLGIHAKESDSRCHREADTIAELDSGKRTSLSNLENQTQTRTTVSTSFERESIPFFEPFHAGAQKSSYISFHFDLSHLEKQETEKSGAGHQTDKLEGNYQNDRDFLAKKDLRVMIRDANSKLRTESVPAASSETLLISDVAGLAPAVVGSVAAVSGPTEGIHGLYQGRNRRRWRYHMEEAQSRCREDMGFPSTQGVATLDNPACLKMRRLPPPPPLPSTRLGMDSEDQDYEEEGSVPEHFRSLLDHMRNQRLDNAEYGDGPHNIFSKGLNLESTVSPKDTRSSRLKWEWPW